MVLSFPAPDLRSVLHISLKSLLVTRYLATYTKISAHVQFKRAKAMVW